MRAALPVQLILEFLVLLLLLLTTTTIKYYYHYYLLLLFDKGLKLLISWLHPPVLYPSRF
jgi:hypothetical protein